MLCEVLPNLSVARQTLIPRCPSFQLQQHSWCESFQNSMNSRLRRLELADPTKNSTIPLNWCKQHHLLMRRFGVPFLVTLMIYSSSESVSEQPLGNPTIYIYIYMYICMYVYIYMDQQMICMKLDVPMFPVHVQLAQKVVMNRCVSSWGIRWEEMSWWTVRPVPGLLLPKNHFVYPSKNPKKISDIMWYPIIPLWLTYTNLY